MRDVLLEIAIGATVAAVCFLLGRAAERRWRPPVEPCKIVVDYKPQAELLELAIERSGLFLAPCNDCFQPVCAADRVMPRCKDCAKIAAQLEANRRAREILGIKEE